MTNLFFMLCWWVGVFTRPEPQLACSGWMAVNPGQQMTIARLGCEPRSFTLYGKTEADILAVIDLNTGKVKLHGNPNEAAKRFWKAVEMMYPGMKKTRE